MFKFAHRTGVFSVLAYRTDPLRDSEAQLLKIRTRWAFCDETSPLPLAVYFKNSQGRGNIFCMGCRTGWAVWSPLSSPSLPFLSPRRRPFNPSRKRSGEAVSCPGGVRSLGQSTSRNPIWCIFGFKKWHLVAEMLVIFLRINLRKSLWYWSEKILILYSFWGLSDTPSQPFIILRVSTYTPDTRWNSPIFHAWLYDVECW